ncbi:MAG: hypothetical protein ACRC7O_16405 [Fimbriiglobus sp.]
MSVNQIREEAERRPFRPIRFVMASGRTYDVTHPENVRVLQRVTSVVVGDGEDAYFATLDNLLLSEIVPLNAANVDR